MIHSIIADPELFFDSKRKIFIYYCFDIGNDVDEVEHTLEELINLGLDKKYCSNIIKQTIKFVSEDDDYIHYLNSALIELL